MKKVLTIAGSDSCGGAGIQADIKTITVHGVYAMSAITALTAQNTLGVQDVSAVSPEFLASQLDSVFSDIVPDAVKIGMVPNTELIEVIIEKLKFYKVKNIVVDPVMVATSGDILIQESTINIMKNELFSLATVITPNILEAQVLSGIEIKNEQDMINASKLISNQYNCAVLCKGGHSINDANDLLYTNNQYTWFIGERIANNNTHGTGCTLSSAIATNLTLEEDLFNSITNAKHYISSALSAMLDLGNGSGPLNHMYMINSNSK